MKKHKLNLPKVEALLVKHLGNKTEVCKELSIDYRSLQNWVYQDSALAEIVEGQNEKTVDFVESKLFQRITGYDEVETFISHYKGEIITQEFIRRYPPDPTCIIFFLKTRGRARGYIEKVGYEITGKTVSEIKFIAVEANGKEGRTIDISPTVEEVE